MADIILGIFAILAGAVMLFAGQFVLRIVIPIWGFFAGFAFGAGLFAELADERFLGTVLGWVTGFVFALIFAVFAYLYYAVAVILAMAAFGFAIGSGLVVALGIDWNWVAVLVGLVVGAVLGLVSVVGNMPMIVLVVLSSIAGAVSVVAGLMLLVRLAELRRLHARATSPTRSRTAGAGTCTLLVLALIGIVVQTRQRVDACAARSARAGTSRARNRPTSVPRRENCDDNGEDHEQDHPAEHRDHRPLQDGADPPDDRCGGGPSASLPGCRGLVVQPRFRGAANRRLVGARTTEPPDHRTADVVDVHHGHVVVAAWAAVDPLGSAPGEAVRRRW